MAIADDHGPPLAHRLWQVVEPLHAVTYFAPETRAATDELGLEGGWMSYFGCRAAPLGAVGAPVVTATFYNFHPAMVARAVPDVWGYASPDQLLAARLEAVDAAYRRIFGDLVEGADVLAAAELISWVAEGCDTAGRPLAAANAALTPPRAPHLRLWQAATVLREHRGDGHVTALVHAGIGPCEALVLQAAIGRTPYSDLRRHRGWTDEEWNRAARNVVASGWLTEAGELTPEGEAVREQVEADTNRLAQEPLVRVGDEAVEQLIDALLPLATRVMTSGEVPVPNMMGLPWPPTHRRAA